MSTAGWGLSGWGDPLVEIPRDRFDALLTSFCTILRHAGDAPNKYGIPDQTPVVIEDNVPCRLSTIGQGTLIIDPLQVAVERWEVFMRPRATYRVNPTHFLKIEAREFAIISVTEPRDRNSAVHHLQIYVREVEPSTALPAPIS